MTAILILIYAIPSIICLWHLFQQQGYKGWMSVIPFYNLWIWLKILEKPFWWFLLLLVPFLNIFMLMLLFVNWSDGFKRYSIIEYFCAALLPFLYFPFVMFYKKEKFVTISTLPKRIKSKPREWFDAIVFAAVAATIIRTYYFESFTIPSSSMEKSLLVGDYLFVSKVHYGPKRPNTPISFPFVHHTLPLTVSTPSYLTWIELPYKRYFGFRNVERNDAVVFHYPEGDTVSTRFQSNVSYYVLLKEYGRERVWNDKANFGNIVVRPVDKRENYVKRCIGISGDTLQIINRQVYINGHKAENPKDLQFNYIITNPMAVSKKKWNETGISLDDIQTLYRTGNVPLSNDLLKAVKTFEGVGEVVPINKPTGEWDHYIFPFSEKYPWNVDNYGPIYIPKAGTTVMLNMDNIVLYSRIIDIYEENDFAIKDSTIYINGKPATSYTFKMNYYWMMGDNRHNSADSRYWGFVPEDHILGKPSFVWLSLDKDKSFPKNIRFNKTFRIVK